MSAIDAPFVKTATSLSVPPLEAGDRLGRKEFERRYEAMPHLKKAELIEGVVYLMASPLNSDLHGSPHYDLITWLGHYRAYTPGVKGSDNATVRLDGTNEPQPHALLYIQPQSGGQVRINQGYIEQAPELIAEISSTTVSLDLHDKFRAYERNGVREYIVWRVRDREIDWFVNRDGKFEPMALDENGVHRSEIFPGLWLDPEALLSENMLRLLEILRQGLASPEHAQFTERLRQAASARQP